ncbi:terminase small subunit [uncultured Clostridium sp.]|uniref:terminase small subunit n=1 Tax=uncultured Clostridium sp. TaxID=59620 RepID=UPI0026172195|nr:terminase small subunit [uncultured Clostridium sp.]
MASKVIKDKVKSKAKLNDRQKRFCIEYLESLNATQSYLKVYPDASYETANVEGCKFLRKPSVKQYINDLLDEYSSNIDITVAEIVANLKKIVLDDKARNSDRIKAMELLGKYKQMFIERKEIDVNSNVIEVTLIDE